jgi:hypothetical protein
MLVRGENRCTTIAPQTGKQGRAYMDKSQLSLLVGSIVSFLLGVVIWVVIRPKLGTEGMVEVKPNTYAAKIYGRLGMQMRI